jgi:hypothetical protein
MAVISYAKCFFVAAGGEHYKLLWGTGRGGGLSNRKVPNSAHETEATGGGRPSNGKVHKDDSIHLSKSVQKVGLQEFGINPKRVRKGEVDDWLLR